MPAGERSQVWYPELVALLRSRWRSDLSWEAMVGLRDHLQSQLQDLRGLRGIVPPVIRCPSCGARGPAAPPTISVRAMLLAVGRFGIEPTEAVRQRERNWRGIVPITSSTWSGGQARAAPQRRDQRMSTELEASSLPRSSPMNPRPANRRLKPTAGAVAVRAAASGREHG